MEHEPVKTQHRTSNRSFYIERDNENKHNRQKQTSDSYNLEAKLWNMSLSTSYNIETRISSREPPLRGLAKGGKQTAQ